MRLLQLKLHWQILIALLFALPAGLLSGRDGGLFGVTFYAVLDFVGTLFLNALKMLIVPLIMASIISGIAGIGSSSALGRLGGRTCCITSLPACWRYWWGWCWST
jgi:Na+/H+-dicarboxylate symporter